MFWAEISNEADRAVALAEAPGHLAVELDGQWYDQRPAKPGPPWRLTDRSTASIRNIVLTEAWRSQKAGAPLTFKPGKHRLRFGITLRAGEKPPRRAVCPPIEIEIIPMGKGAAEPRAMQQRWREMGSDDHKLAYAAVDRLAGADAAAAAFLRERIEPVLAKADEKGLARLIAELDHEQTAVRRQAFEHIAMLGRWAAPALSAALPEAKSPQQRTALRELIAGAEPLLPATEGRRRMVRAVRALELVGSPQTEALIESIESSPAGLPLRCFRVEKQLLEVGFVPDRTSLVLGKPAAGGLPLTAAARGALFSCQGPQETSS